VESGIAVMGHIGLTPQGVSVLGGFRAQGEFELKCVYDFTYFVCFMYFSCVHVKQLIVFNPGRTASKAFNIIQDAVALEKAGAFALGD
jgi:ketopantoate hydroxymethyltransferase